jgi:hypothetical protein
MVVAREKDRTVPAEDSDNHRHRHPQRPRILPNLPAVLSSLQPLLYLVRAHVFNMPDFISSFHPSFKFRGNYYTNRHWSSYVMLFHGSRYTYSCNHLRTVSATHSPRPPPSSKSTGLPLGLIIGASVGGMVLGALLVTLVFFWRRRRAQRTARRSQAILMGKQDEGSHPPTRLVELALTFFYSQKKDH